jgi:tetratricopeptide (TPR) repeat protein
MIVDTRHSLFWKAVEYAFYLFFMLFPFVNYSTYLYGGTATRSLNLIVFTTVLSIGFACWLCTKNSSVSLVKSPPFIALVLYFISLFISGLVGLNFATTFWSVATRMTGLWYLLFLGLFMLLLWAVIEDEYRHHKLILAVTCSTALYSLIELLGEDGFGLLFTNLKEASTLGNTTFAAMYVFGAFLLSLYYLFQAEVKKWWMYVLPAVLIVNPLIINVEWFMGDFSHGPIGEAQATSISVFLSLIALFGIWLVSKMKNTTTRTRVSYSLFGIGALAMLVAGFSLVSPNGYLREVYLSGSTAARPLVWEMSTIAIGQRPAFGWGADNFERVFEQNYDNRLLQNEYGNEAWFDRAHNMFIDQLVDNGFVGLFLFVVAYLVTILALIYSALSAVGKRDRLFASVLIVYFTFHIAELQTAFDTSISYPLVAFMFVSAAILYCRARVAHAASLTIVLTPAAKYTVAAAIIGFVGWSFFAGVLPFIRAQEANGAIRQVGSSDKRLALYPALFGSPIDEQAFLWRTATDFQRGIAADTQVLSDPKKVEKLKQELVILEEGYAKYIEQNPDNFRAHLNLADVLIYQMLFDVNKLEEAQAVLDRAIALVPESPQSYWLKAVAYVYMQKFDLAREYAQKGLALNPKIVQSQNVVKYVEDSIKSFPRIQLYFFRQI